MHIKVKRIYEKPLPSDGYRVLVDRLWPRGISKKEAKIDLWLKDATPSGELRKWFHADREKNFKTFQLKYEKELKKSRLLIERDLENINSDITLITAVKDIQNSHIPTLVAFLKKFK